VKLGAIGRKGRVKPNRPSYRGCGCGPLNRNAQACRSAIFRSMGCACLIPLNTREKHQPAVGFAQRVQYCGYEPQVEAKEHERAQLKPMDDYPTHVARSIGPLSRGAGSGDDTFFGRTDDTEFLAPARPAPRRHDRASLQQNSRTGCRFRRLAAARRDCRTGPSRTVRARLERPVLPVLSGRDQASVTPSRTIARPRTGADRPQRYNATMAIA